MTFIPLKLQVSFCQDLWQNIGECPYVYKRSSIQTQWQELFQPASMDAFELEYDFVHVRVFTYILAYFKCSQWAGYLPGDGWTCPGHWILRYGMADQHKIVHLVPYLEIQWAG